MKIGGLGVDLQLAGPLHAAPPQTGAAAQISRRYAMLCEAEQQLARSMSAVKSDAKPLRQLTEDIDAGGLRRLIPYIMMRIVLDQRRDILSRPPSARQVLRGRDDVTNIFRSGNLLDNRARRDSAFHLRCGGHRKPSAAHLAVCDQGIVGPAHVGLGVLGHPGDTRQGRDVECSLDEVLRAGGGAHD